MGSSVKEAGGVNGINSGGGLLRHLRGLPRRDDAVRSETADGKGFGPLAGWVRGRWAVQRAALKAHWGGGDDGALGRWGGRLE